MTLNSIRAAIPQATVSSISDQSQHGPRHPGNIVFLDQKAGLLMDYNIRNTRMPRGHHGQPTRPGLKHRHWCPLAIAIVRDD